MDIVLPTSLLLLVPNASNELPRWCYFGLGERKSSILSWDLLRGLLDSDVKFKLSDLSILPNTHSFINPAKKFYKINSLKRGQSEGDVHCAGMGAGYSVGCAGWTSLARGLRGIYFPSFYLCRLTTTDWCVISTEFNDSLELLGLVRSEAEAWRKNCVNNFGDKKPNLLEAFVKYPSLAFLYLTPILYH